MSFNGNGRLSEQPEERVGARTEMPAGVQEAAEDRVSAVWGQSLLVAMELVHQHLYDLRGQR